MLAVGVALASVAGVVALLTGRSQVVVGVVGRMVDEVRGREDHLSGRSILLIYLIFLNSDLKSAFSIW